MKLEGRRQCSTVYSNRLVIGASIPDVFEVPAGRPAADLDHVVGGEAVEAVAGGQRRHVDQAEGKLHKHLVLGLVLKQDG